MSMANSSPNYEAFDAYVRVCNMHYVFPDVDFIRTLWTLDTVGFDAAPHKGRFGPCLGAFLADTRRVVLPGTLAGELLMFPEFRDGRLRPLLQAIEDQGRLGIDLGAAEALCDQRRQEKRLEPTTWRTKRVAEIYAALDPDHSPFAKRYNQPNVKYRDGHSEYITASEYELFAREFGDSDIRAHVAQLNVPAFSGEYEYDPKIHSYPDDCTRPTPNGYRTTDSIWGRAAEFSLISAFCIANWHVYHFGFQDINTGHRRWFGARYMGLNDPTFEVPEDIDDPKERENYRALIGSICVLSERLRIGRLGTPLFRAAFRAPWYHRAEATLPISTATSFDYLIEAVLAGRLAPENLIQAARCQVRVAGPERLLIQPDSLRPALPDDLDPISRLAIEAVWEDGIVPPADNGIALATRLPLRTARYHWTALDHRLNARPAPTVAQAKLIVETTLKQSRRDSLARGARRDGIVDFPRFVAFLRNQHLNPEPGRPANMIVPPETLEHIEKIAEREMFHIFFINEGIIHRNDEFRYKRRLYKYIDYFDLDADDVLRKHATLGFNCKDIYENTRHKIEDVDMTNKPYAREFLEPWVYPFSANLPTELDYFSIFPYGKGIMGAFAEEYMRELYANHQYIFKGSASSNVEEIGMGCFYSGELIREEEVEIERYGSAMRFKYLDYNHGIINGNE